MENYKPKVHKLTGLGRAETSPPSVTTSKTAQYLTFGMISSVRPIVGGLRVKKTCRKGTSILWVEALQPSPSNQSPKWEPFATAHPTGI